MTKELYIFSGLGADERMFQRLDFSGYTTTYIKWMEPLNEETIEHYAARLIGQIKSNNPTLMGLSFGGIMAIEVAKQMATKKVILIASAKTKKEIPFYFRAAGYLRLHKLLPTRLMKKSNVITNWFFGARASFDQQLLKQILLDTDPAFLNWAIDKILLWRNETEVKNVLHIHGTRDRILPKYFVNCDFTIKDGGHLMTLNRADEMNDVIRKLL